MLKPFRRPLLCSSEQHPRGLSPKGAVRMVVLADGEGPAHGGRGTHVDGSLGPGLFEAQFVVCAADLAVHAFEGKAHVHGLDGDLECSLALAVDEHRHRPLGNTAERNVPVPLGLGDLRQRLALGQPGRLAHRLPRNVFRPALLRGGSRGCGRRLGLLRCIVICCGAAAKDGASGVAGPNRALAPATRSTDLGTLATNGLNRHRLNRGEHRSRITNHERSVRPTVTRAAEDNPTVGQLVGQPPDQCKRPIHVKRSH